MIDMETLMIDDNYKDRLMRYCQQIKIDLPQYPIDFHNNGVFGVSVIVDGNVMASGSAKNKKQAEQNAAREAIKLLDIV